MRRLIGAVALIALCSVPSACARPLGDFGRAQDSVLHDEVLPVIGKGRSLFSKEPVSSFNLTDQETEMHDRVWRFLVSPHSYDWFYDIVVELERTRISSTQVHNFKPDRYYGYLSSERFASSRTRFRSIADSAKSDVDTSPTTFVAICRVIEVDRQRSVASDGLGGMSAGEVRARHAENEMWIDWFVSSLRYRYDSYSYALDHLLVETPHEEAVEVDGRLSQLAMWVDRAEAGDFCNSGGITLSAGGNGAIPSRILMDAPSEGEYRK